MRYIIYISSLGNYCFKLINNSVFLCYYDYFFILDKDIFNENESEEKE